MAISFENDPLTSLDADTADDTDQAVAPVMNTTPLIDVLLVLLVMLIITIPIQLHSVRMDLPAGVPPADMPAADVLKLDISEDSAVLVNGNPVKDLAELRNHLQQAARALQQPEIHVQARATTPYDTVAAVLTMAQREGLMKIGVVGLEEYAASPSGP